jgi:hypothetical protein
MSLFLAKQTAPTAYTSQNHDLKAAAPAVILG